MNSRIVLLLYRSFRCSLLVLAFAWCYLDAGACAILLYGRGTTGCGMGEHCTCCDSCQGRSRNDGAGCPGYCSLRSQGCKTSSSLEIPAVVKDVQLTILPVNTVPQTSRDYRSHEPAAAPAILPHAIFHPPEPTPLRTI